MDAGDEAELVPRGRAALAVDTLCGLSSGPQPRRLPDAAPLILVSATDAGGLQLEIRGPQTRAPEGLGELQWLLGARIRPELARGLLGVPLSELADRRVALSELWPREQEPTEQALRAAPTLAARLEAVHALLERRMQREDERDRPAAVVLEALRRLDRGAQRVEPLAQALGISPRHLRRLFLESVGLTPKEYASLLRFRRAASQGLGEREVQWADLAMTHGYYDQAHLISDFRRRTGLTPTGWSREAASR